MDFMCVSSYGSGTVSSGRVKIIKDLDENIEGKHVLIAEDIVDSGNTLSTLIKILQVRKPASIRLYASGQAGTPCGGYQSGLQLL